MMAIGASEELIFVNDDFELRSNSWKHVCFNCGKLDPVVVKWHCEICDQAEYCGPACQKAHWSEHSAPCRAISEKRCIITNILKKIKKCACLLFYLERKHMTPTQIRRANAFRSIKSSAFLDGDQVVIFPHFNREEWYTFKVKLENNIHSIRKHLRVEGEGENHGAIWSYMTQGQRKYYCNSAKMAVEQGVSYGISSICAHISGGASIQHLACGLGYSIPTSENGVLVMHQWTPNDFNSLLGALQVCTHHPIFLSLRGVNVITSINDVQSPFARVQSISFVKSNICMSRPRVALFDEALKHMAIPLTELNFHGCVIEAGAWVPLQEVLVRQTSLQAFTVINVHKPGRSQEELQAAPGSSPNSWRDMLPLLIQSWPVLRMLHIGVSIFSTALAKVLAANRTITELNLNGGDDHGKFDSDCGDLDFWANASLSMLLERNTTVTSLNISLSYDEYSAKQRWKTLDAYLPNGFGSNTTLKTLIAQNGCFGRVDVSMLANHASLTSIDISNWWWEDSVKNLPYFFLQLKERRNPLNLRALTMTHRLLVMAPYDGLSSEKCWRALFDFLSKTSSPLESLTMFTFERREESYDPLTGEVTGRVERGYIQSILARKDRALFLHRHRWRAFVVLYMRLLCQNERAAPCSTDTDSGINGFPVMPLIGALSVPACLFRDGKIK